MKYLPNIAGALLGLLFIFVSVMVLFELGPKPPAIPENTPAGHFMAAFMPTGYMKFVKVCELLGGIMVAIPRTRNFGLLFLGPVILNILAFHTFLTKGDGLLNPMLIVIVLLAAYLLWAGRHKFLALRN